MRFTGFRLPLLAAVASAGVGLFVWATDRTYGDTLLVYPTSATISVSRPYVSTSYYVPSSYVIPSYVETAYTVSPTVSLWPTGYVETTYRRGLFGRRWVVERPVVAAYPTAYVPTTYVSSYVPTTYVSSYVPTTYVPTYYSTGYRVRSYRPTAYTYYPTTYFPTLYETAYTTAADLCCDTPVVVDSTVRALPPASAASSEGYSNSSGREVESSSAYEDTIDSRVMPLPEQRSAAPGGQGSGAQTKAAGKRADSPPAEPTATPKDAANKEATKKDAGGAPAASKKAAVPAAPADDPDDLQPAPQAGEGVLRRESLRPTYSRMRAAARRNVLFGTVETDNGAARSEVPVVVVNRRNTLVQRTGSSDAFGTFAIRVPDGEWIVQVTMPSGNRQTVRNITVTDGRVVDNLERREVQNLIISF